MFLACMSLSGCFNFGARWLYEDQLGYSRALGDAEKSDTLLNVVRLRYADTPIFLQATQVISGYQLQRNVTGGFEAFPAANPSTFLNGSTSSQLQQSPTFTFQPLSGAQFAQSFIRPLSPADLLPLAMLILLIGEFRYQNKRDGAARSPAGPPPLTLPTQEVEQGDD